MSEVTDKSEQGQRLDAKMPNLSKSECAAAQMYPKDSPTCYQTVYIYIYDAAKVSRMYRFFSAKMTVSRNNNFDQPWTLVDLKHMMHHNIIMHKK